MDLNKYQTLIKIIISASISARGCGIDIKILLIFSQPIIL
jgi:hypothetical protein